MRTQSLKTRCVWASLAFFSVIALFGNGLHYLPGMGHSGCGHVEPFNHDCGSSSFTVAHDSVGGIGAASSLDADHDCPICHFLAQAKTVILAVHFEGSGELVCRFVAACSSSTFQSFPAAYQSRGPPSPHFFA